MKRLAILLVAVGWLGWASSSQAATRCNNTSLGNNVNCIQSNNTTRTGGTPFTQTLAYSTNPTIHDALYVFVAAWNNGNTAPTLATPTDTLTNTYVLMQPCTKLEAGGSSSILCAWYVENNLSTGADTPSVLGTATGGGTTLDMDMIITEYSGLNTSGSLDQVNSATSTGTGSLSTGNITTTSAYEILISYAYDPQAAVTFSVSSGTIRENTSNADGESAANSDQEVTAIGTYSQTWTHPSEKIHAGIASFKYPAPAPPPPTLTGKVTGQIISGALLPQVTPSVVYPNESGYIITPVAGGANLQTAITAAACGTILSTAHGGTLSGASAFTLPNNSCACHTDPTKWIIIRSDAFVGGSSRGVRTDPSLEYANYTHITNSDANYGISALANGASCWWLGPGLDITESTDGANAVIVTDDGSQSIANYTHDIVIDHSYVHGQATKGVTRCIYGNGKFISVVDSYISDCHKVGQDAQAFLAFDGTGGDLLSNNFLEGSTENVLFGGANPQVGVILADVTIKNNHIYKPVSWRLEDPTYIGIHWAVKNLLEFKTLQRALVTGNVLESNWADGQVGIPHLFNNGCSNTSSQYNYIQDITEYYNIFRHSTGALSFGACGTEPTNEPTHRVSITDTLFYDLDQRVWSKSFPSGYVVLLGGIPAGSIVAPFDIYMNHVTFAAGLTTGTVNETEGLYFVNTPDVDFKYGIQAKNSIIPIGGSPGSSSAFLGAASSGGDGVITHYAPNLVANNDCMYGSENYAYTSAVWSGRQNPANEAAIFVTPGSNFQVAASSVCHNAASDGTDMGANITALNAATASTVQALSCPVTVTNVSASTFTHLGGTGITITGTCFLQESGLGVIIGGAGPAAAVNTDICSINTCTVNMSAPISLQVNDTVVMVGMNGGNSDTGEFIVASVTDTTHFTYTDTGIGTQSWTGGTANRSSPGNPCTSVSVVSPTSITCTTPAASGTVTTGPVSVFVSQFGIPVQSIVFGTYN